jgi:hypothetical protein
VLQRHVLDLGEINVSQEWAWRKSIEVVEDGAKALRVRGTAKCHRTSDLVSTPGSSVSSVAGPAGVLPGGLKATGISAYHVCAEA